jgi:hypothetical protein
VKNYKKYFWYLSIASILLLAAITLSNYLNISANHQGDNILEYTVIIKNHKFFPDIITAPAGKKIRLVIHNQDNTVEEFESNELHREKIVMPNDTITIILAPLLPNKYEFFGDFHQETARGVLIVN